MKTALITTTINIPKVLDLYRKIGPDVMFFVAGDEKTPTAMSFANTFAHGDKLQYLEPDRQKNWHCSELIGWNCIQRRNIALLEALKWGANIVVSIDDDNIPMDLHYFSDFVRPLHPYYLWNGLGISAVQSWFDVGRLLHPQASHRGFPHDIKPDLNITHATDARIGVAAGICLGDPDISATTRIAAAPIVHQVSEILQAGIVTNPDNTWTVYNSQNTAFIRELAPAMFMLPGCGRFDDIYASLITQHVMSARDLYVHFGRPFVWQQRNPHDLIKDLTLEITGMQNVRKLADLLTEIHLTGESVLDDLRIIFNMLQHANWFPSIAVQAARAWLIDCETVL